LKTTDKLN